MKIGSGGLDHARFLTACWKVGGTGGMRLTV